jgi:hypothetical protein
MTPVFNMFKEIKHEIERNENYGGEESGDCSLK